MIPMLNRSEMKRLSPALSEVERGKMARLTPRDDGHMAGHRSGVISCNDTIFGIQI